MLALRAHRPRRAFRAASLICSISVRWAAASIKNRFSSYSELLVSLRTDVHITLFIEAKLVVLIFRRWYFFSLAAFALRGFLSFRSRRHNRPTVLPVFGVHDFVFSEVSTLLSADRKCDFPAFIGSLGTVMFIRYVKKSEDFCL